MSVFACAMPDYPRSPTTSTRPPQPKQNAYKATIESAQRKNMNSLPAIQIRIFPGRDEVCVRVRDYVSNGGAGAVV